MANEGPLVNLVGYKDIFLNGVVLPRKAAINFVEGVVVDNPALGATDVVLGGGLVSNTVAVSGSGPVGYGELRRYVGNAGDFTLTLQSSPAPVDGIRLGVVEILGGGDQITIDSGGNTVANPLIRAIPPVSGTTSADFSVPFIKCIWAWDGENSEWRVDELVSSQASAVDTATLSADTDDYNPTGLKAKMGTEGITVFKFTTTGAVRSLTGIVPSNARDGKRLAIMNVGALDLVLMDDVTSTEANRFLIASGNITVPPKGVATVMRDSDASRWRVS